MFFSEVNISLSEYKNTEVEADAGFLMAYF